MIITMVLFSFISLKSINIYFCGNMDLFKWNVYKLKDSLAKKSNLCRDSVGFKIKEFFSILQDFGDCQNVNWMLRDIKEVNIQIYLHENFKKSKNKKHKKKISWKFSKKNII